MKKVKEGAFWFALLALCGSVVAGVLAFDFEPRLGQFLLYITVIAEIILCSTILGIYLEQSSQKPTKKVNPLDDLLERQKDIYKTLEKAIACPSERKKKTKKWDFQPIYDIMKHLGWKKYDVKFEDDATFIVPKGKEYHAVDELRELEVAAYRKAGFKFKGSAVPDKMRLKVRDERPTGSSPDTYSRDDTLEYWTSLRDKLLSSKPKKEKKKETKRIPRGALMVGKKDRRTFLT